VSVPVRVAASQRQRQVRVYAVRRRERRGGGNVQMLEETAVRQTAS